MRGRGRLAVAAAVAVVTASSACSKLPVPPPAPRSLTIAHESDVLTLDPAASPEVATSSVLNNIFEGLVAFDKDMKVVPALAASWTAVDDRTWLFNLRSGVRFHDGSLLSSADVTASIVRGQTDPASGYRAELSNVAQVEAVDPMTVQVKTRWPDALLLNRLASVLVSRAGAAPAPPAHPIGTGPYRFVSWEKGQALQVEVFDGYWGRRPAFAHVRFVAVEEGRKGLEALTRGDVDVLRWVPETMVDEVRKHPELRLETRPSLVTYFLWFNSAPGGNGRRNPFSDRRVRMAIGLAVDRPAIVRALGGRGVVANQLVQKGVFGYVGSLPEIEFDPDRARALLKEAGYGGGFEVTLAHRSGVSVSSVAALLQKMLGDVGIRVKLQAPDWGEVLSGWKQARIPLFLAGWRFDNGDALSFLRDCLYTRHIDAGYGTYNPGFSSPALDRLIDENSRTLGELKRLKQYEEVMRAALDEMPIVPLYTGYDIYGVSNRVRWQPRLDESLLAAEMTPADMAPAE